MKKIFFACFLFACNFFVTAQTPVYQKTYGGNAYDAAGCLITTSDGGYAMVGSTNSYGAGGFDILLIKLDANANIQWSRTYGGTGDDQGSKLVQTSDDGFVICGRTASFGSGDFDGFLLKTDNTGSLLWLKTYGGTAEDQVSNIRQTSDHGFILSGSTLSFGQGDWDMMFIKTDINGDTLWTKIMGGTGYDQGTDAEQTNDGGYIFSGRVFDSGSGSVDSYLAKTNGTGDTLWTRTFGGAGWDEAMKVKQTADGGYIIPGGSTGFTNGSYDAYLNKFDSAGQISWSKIYSGLYADATYDVIQLDDGGYIIVGETESFGLNHLKMGTDPKAGVSESVILPGFHIMGSDHSNVLVIRTAANGDTVWTRVYGGGLQDEAYSIIGTPDKGFMVAAYALSFGSDSTDFYLIKADSTGFSGCNEEPAGPVVIVPPTVEMSNSLQIVSGLTLTAISILESPVSVTQNDICFATGIKMQAPNSANMSISPNPCSSLAAIQIPAQYDNFSEAEIFVYDIYGRTIKKLKAHNGEKIQIPVNDLASGIYEVKMSLNPLNNSEKIIFTAKLSVQ